MCAIPDALSTRRHTLHSPFRLKASDNMSRTDSLLINSKDRSPPVVNHRKQRNPGTESCELGLLLLLRHPPISPLLLVLYPGVLLRLPMFRKVSILILRLLLYYYYLFASVDGGFAFPFIIRSIIVYGIGGPILLLITVHVHLLFGIGSLSIVMVGSDGLLMLAIRHSI